MSGPVNGTVPPPPLTTAPDPTPTEVREAQERAADGLGLLTLLRDLERHAGDRPRIGRNTRLRDALVHLGQDPDLSFPDTDLARVDLKRATPLVRAQFLGFYGAFGALPLNWTEEIRRWFDANDQSFVAFSDIFATRFQELFFRAWSDSHAITQFDHPTDDRFQTYILALLGIGTPAFRDRDGLSDTVKLRLAPLAAGRVKSPVRLRQMLQVHFGAAARIEVEEMVASWLDFEPDTLSQIGMQGATLGRDVHLGSRVVSVGEKIRLHLHVPTLDAYDRFLPGGPDYTQMRDLVFWYLGQTFQVEVVLWLPEPQVQPAILGQSSRLGWMACLAPDPGNPDHRVDATHYALEPDRTKTTDQSRHAA